MPYIKCINLKLLKMRVVNILFIMLTAHFLNHFLELHLSRYCLDTFEFTYFKKCIHIKNKHSYLVLFVDFSNSITGEMRFFCNHHLILYVSPLAFIAAVRISEAFTYIDTNELLI